MATNEEVEDQRARVVELRAQLEDVKSGAVDTQRDLENEIVLTQLQAEEARLQADLALAQQAVHPSAVARGVAAPLGSIQEQMERSVAHQKAVADEIRDANKTDAPSTPTPSSNPSVAPEVTPAVSTKTVKG